MGFFDDDPAEQKRKAIREANKSDVDIYLITLVVTIGLVIALLAWVKVSPPPPVSRPSPTQAQ